MKLDNQIAFRYAELESPSKKVPKVKVVGILMNDELVAEFEAEQFIDWLAQKEREICEWITTGKVMKWHKTKSKITKKDKDTLRYMG